MQGHPETIWAKEQEFGEGDFWYCYWHEECEKYIRADVVEKRIAGLESKIEDLQNNRGDLEWDGKTRVTDLPLGVDSWVWIDGGWHQRFTNDGLRELMADCPAIIRPFYREPKPLKEEVGA